MQLSDFQTTDGYFTIAPFDHRASLAEALKLDLQITTDSDTFLSLKQMFMRILSPHVSAVLTDPEYGIKTLDEKDGRAGLFLSLEESGYSGDHDAVTKLKEQWGVPMIKLRNAGAKLLVYYNPKSSTAGEKLELVKRVYEECRNEGVIFLLEPVMYPLLDTPLWLGEGDSDWVSTHLSVCQEFAPYCDILKIQYPGNLDACTKVTSFHKNWVLLSRGAAFEQFCTYLQTSVRGGSKGYAAGRAVWQEIEKLAPDQWEEFLKTTAVKRLEELTRILRSSRLVA